MQGWHILKDSHACESHLYLTNPREQEIRKKMDNGGKKEYKTWQKTQKMKVLKGRETAHEEEIDK